jgi:hypothetical protein
MRVISKQNETTLIFAAMLTSATLIVLLLPLLFGGGSSEYQQRSAGRIGDAVQEKASITTAPQPQLFDSPPAGCCEIDVIEPSKGQPVDMFTDVLYRVRGDVPKGFRDVLWVRDSFGQYWSWGSQLGGVPQRVQIGQRGDAGQGFEVGVIITNEPFPKGNMSQALPPALATQVATVVRR